MRSFRVRALFLLGAAATVLSLSAAERLKVGVPVVRDFGPDGVAGFPMLTFSDVTSPSRVRVSYATHPDGLGERGDFWHETRATYMGKDVWLPILPANTDRFDVFSLTSNGLYRAGLSQGLVRYARIVLESGDATLDDIRFENDGTFAEDPLVGSFSCSDERLNAVWRACVRTCRLAAIPARAKPRFFSGVHTNALLGVTYAFLSDGAKRDRLVWSGDLWFAQRNMYSAFDLKAPYMRGSLMMLSENQTPEGYVQACPYPESHGSLGNGDYGPFASDEFAAWFIPVLRDHILHAADAELLFKTWPTVCRLVKYLLSNTREDGLFEQRLATCKHSCGLAVGGTSLHHRAYMNILLWKSLRDAADLGDELGVDSIDMRLWRERADLLATTVRRRFWDSKTGGFVLSLEDRSFGFEANALALATRFATGTEARAIGGSPLFRRHGHGKFQALAIRGLFEYDEAERAYAMIAAHNWFRVIDPSWKGTRTIQECCNVIASGWGDEAHPDACIAGILSNYILGVEPLTSGYAWFKVDPRRPHGITWAKGRVPTPCGFIDVEWHLEDNRVVLNVKHPKELSGVGRDGAKL